MMSDAMAAIDAVETMLGVGSGFDHIESYIDALDLPNDHKSGLWLLAWASQDPRERIAEVRRQFMLAAVCA